jgi:hypothetical protein
MNEMPLIMNKDLAYLMGFIIGDGNLGQGYIIRAVEEHKEFIESYTNLFEKVFNRRPKIYFDKFNNSYVAYLHSKAIWNFFVSNGIPSGTKSRTARLPSEIRDTEFAKYFISGIFDAEGSIFLMKDSHHMNGYPRIQFKIHNHGLTKDIFDELVGIGLKPRLYKYKEFSMIHINGRKQCKIFHVNVGFQHPIKKRKLGAS